MTVSNPEIESPSPPEIRLIRRAAIIHPDQAGLTCIAEAARNVEHWDRVIALSERHGITNLLRQHLQVCDVTLPKPARQQLLALRVRHLRANRIRMAALAEMLRALDQSGIPVAVLKGAALVNLIYPSPDMRPMGDIDLLTPPEKAIAAQAVLRELGYHAEDQQSGALANHHHLPAACREDSGVQVLVEVHTDALSRDIGGNLDWAVVSSNLQPFTVDGVIGQALGHGDMLHHLCRHTLEPVAWTKLIALADIYGYSAHFGADIPWEQLNDRQPFIINMLTLLGCLAPPPESLKHRLPSVEGACPADAGKGYPPLSTILGTQAPLLDKMRQLMTAPAWWLHCFYNVPPQHSLLITRTLRHPANVLRWIVRRFLTGLKSRMS